MSSLNALRRRVVQLAYDAGEGHIASAFSILDIIHVLYDKILQPEDCFVLSKGHGCLALYVVLAEKGIITEEQLKSYLKFDGVLGGHPDRNKVPGVLCSTGSLGHGLPQAVGIALAKKIKGEAGGVYCLIGDGECNEGSIWEACLLAAHHKLDNLMVIMDNNGSSTRAVNLGDIGEKFSVFGFSVYKNIMSKQPPPDEPSIFMFALGDGFLFGKYNNRPTAAIINTTKGAGCERMSSPAWHHRVPTEEELP